MLTSSNDNRNHNDPSWNLQVTLRESLPAMLARDHQDLAEIQHQHLANNIASRMTQHQTLPSKYGYDMVWYFIVCDGVSYRTFRLQICRRLGKGGAARAPPKKVASPTLRSMYTSWASWTKWRAKYERCWNCQKYIKTFQSHSPICNRWSNFSSHTTNLASSWNRNSKKLTSK